MSQTLHVESSHQPVFRELGLDAEGIFSQELIKPWRRLPDRENCTLDATLLDGRRVRWHVKRYAGSDTNAELAGHRLLVRHQIPTAELIAWGSLDDSRSFVIFEDLSGYQAGDKLVESGFAFENLLKPTANLAATLHSASLHHRDLYLCHFFVKPDGKEPEVRLIDSARVKQLPRFFTQRWIVKDLAQFWYSTLPLKVTDDDRAAWLSQYSTARGLGADETRALSAAILRKVDWIARHDAVLRRRQPDRNVSIPK